MSFNKLITKRYFFLSKSKATIEAYIKKTHIFNNSTTIQHQKFTRNHKHIGSVLIVNNIKNETA